MKPSYPTSQAARSYHLLLRTCMILALFSSVLTFATPAEASSTVYKGKLRTAIKTLKVANENATGYNRDSFKHWTDANSNGCDARNEVLIAEATVKPTVGAGCELIGGQWRSYYDNMTTTDPGTFDVDHMVPLAEAFGSGARSWSAATREAYANDLGDARSLVAVSATSNRSKSDRDPAEWTPKKAKCRYIAEYVAVKIRWKLTVDRAEKKALVKYASKCKNVKIRVAKATITKGETPTSTNGDSTGLRVTAIAYDPAGTDTVDAEIVYLTNVTSAPIRINGWVLQDEAGTNYTFPDATVAPGAELRLHTGPGAPTATDLYAGSGSSWWNNDGDLFKLFNPSGSLMQVGRYTGAGDGSVARF